MHVKYGTRKKDKFIKIQELMNFIIMETRLNISDVPKIEIIDINSRVFGQFHYKENKIIINKWTIKNRLIMYLEGLDYKFLDIVNMNLWTFTIAHELRHSWQFQNGILDIKTNYVIYNGYIYDLKSTLTQPWEADANKFAMSYVLSKLDFVPRYITLEDLNCIKYETAESLKIETYTKEAIQ